MVKYYNDGNLKNNLNRTREMILRKRRKLKNRECCYINGQILETEKEFSCLGVKLESSENVGDKKV